jgi:hypothetical protein
MIIAARPSGIPTALATGGAGETAVMVVGTWADRRDLVVDDEGAGWRVRGIALDTMVRIAWEVDDIAALQDPALTRTVAALALPSPHHAVAVGPDGESALQATAAPAGRARPGTPSWRPDDGTVNENYCDVELRASTETGADDGVLLAAYAQGILGRRHDSALVHAVRHEQPAAYSVRTTAIDIGGRLSVRARIGGQPSSCRVRREAAWQVASRTPEPVGVELVLRTVRARTSTEVAGGGERAALALEMLSRLDPVIERHGWDGCADRVAGAWPALAWRPTEHRHDGGAR